MRSPLTALSLAVFLLVPAGALDAASDCAPAHPGASQRTDGAQADLSQWTAKDTVEGCPGPAVPRCEHPARPDGDVGAIAEPPQQPTLAATPQRAVGTDVPPRDPPPTLAGSAAPPANEPLFIRHCALLL